MNGRGKLGTPARIIKGFSEYEQHEIASEIKSIISFSQAVPQQRSPGGTALSSELVSDSIGYEFDMEATLKLGKVGLFPGGH